MSKKNPYSVIKSQHVTEKSMVLEQLHENESNPAVRACQNPKAVFLVHSRATKPEIKQAVEAIYADKNVKVTAVNTINLKGKPRRVRGRSGYTSGRKKAVVTLSKGDSIKNV